MQNYACITELFPTLPVSFFRTSTANVYGYKFNLDDMEILNTYKMATHWCFTAHSNLWLQTGTAMVKWAINTSFFLA